MDLNHFARKLMRRASAREVPPGSRFASVAEAAMKAKADADRQASQRQASQRLLPSVRGFFNPAFNVFREKSRPKGGSESDKPARMSARESKRLSNRLSNRLSTRHSARDSNGSVKSNGSAASNGSSKGGRKKGNMEKDRKKCAPLRTPVLQGSSPPSLQPSVRCPPPVPPQVARRAPVATPLRSQHITPPESPSSTDLDSSFTSATSQQSANFRSIVFAGEPETAHSTARTDRSALSDFRAHRV